MNVLAWFDALSFADVVTALAVVLAAWLIITESVERKLSRDHNWRHSWVLAAMLTLAPGRDHTALATAIERAVDEDGPVFGGPDGAIRTKALMVAIAFRESSFRLDALGDKGASFCAFQIFGGSRTLLDDVDACTREGLKRLRKSVDHCPKFPVATYAAGPSGCGLPRAQRISNDRMHIARTLIQKVSNP